MPRDDLDHALLTAVGSRIAEIRRSRGLTQASVSEAAGLDPQSFQRAETGRSSLSLTRLRRVAFALGVEMAELFTTVGSTVPSTPWSPDEAVAAAAWRRIPVDRRDLALRVLDDLTP